MGTVNKAGTFTGVGAGDVVKLTGKFDVLIEGGAGTVAIERSLDDEATWQVVSQDSTGAAASYTSASDVAFNGMLEEPDSDIPYRLNCTAYTSGDINWRIRGR